MIRRMVADALRFSERPGVNFDGQAAAAGGEDTHFVQAAVSRGYKAHYVPVACVKHIVRPHQVGIYQVLQRYPRIGRAMALSGARPFDPTAARLLGYTRYLYQTLPPAVLRPFGPRASAHPFAPAHPLLRTATP